MLISDNKYQWPWHRGTKYLKKKIFKNYKISDLTAEKRRIWLFSNWIIYLISNNSFVSYIDWIKSIHFKGLGSNQKKMKRFINLDKQGKLRLNRKPVRLSVYGNQSYCVYERINKNYCFYKKQLASKSASVD